MPQSPLIFAFSSTKCWVWHEKDKTPDIKCWIKDFWHIANCPKIDFFYHNCHQQYRQVSSLASLSELKDSLVTWHDEKNGTTQSESTHSTFSPFLALNLAYIKYLNTLGFILSAHRISEFIYEQPLMLAAKKVGSMQIYIYKIIHPFFENFVAASSLNYGHWIAENLHALWDEPKEGFWTLSSKPLKVKMA